MAAVSSFSNFSTSLTFGSAVRIFPVLIAFCSSSIVSSAVLFGIGPFVKPKTRINVFDQPPFFFIKFRLIKILACMK